MAKRKRKTPVRSVSGETIRLLGQHLVSLLKGNPEYRKHLKYSDKGVSKMRDFAICKYLGRIEQEWGCTADMAVDALGETILGKTMYACIVGNGKHYLKGERQSLAKLRKKLCGNLDCGWSIVPCRFKPVELLKDSYWAAAGR